VSLKRKGCLFQSEFPNPKGYTQEKVVCIESILQQGLTELIQI